MSASCAASTTVVADEYVSADSLIMDGTWEVTAKPLLAPNGRVHSQKDLDECWAAGCDEQQVAGHDCSPVLVHFGHCFVAVCHQ